MPRLSISWAKLPAEFVSAVVVKEVAASVEVEVVVSSVLAVVAVPAVVLVSDDVPDGGGPGGGPGGMPPGPPIPPEPSCVLPLVVPDEFIICAMTAAIVAPIWAEPVVTSTVRVLPVAVEVVPSDEALAVEKSPALAAWLCISWRR